MNPAQNTAIDLLKLPDERYFDINEQDLRALRGPLAPTDEEFEAGTVPPVLAIGMPRTVNVEEKQRVPVLIAKRLTGQRAWEVDIRQNLTWFIVDLRSGQVMAETAQAGDKRRATPKPSRTPPAPGAVNQTAVTYGIERMGLPAVFGRDWPSDRYAATLVMYDWVSNTAVFTRQPPPAPAGEPRGALSLFIEAVPGPITDGKPGVVLSLPKDVAAGGPIPVQAVLSLPREQLVLVKSAEPEGAPLLPVSLVLLKLDSATPILIDMDVPAAVDGTTVNTRFSVDLHKVAPSETLSGEYQVYLVTGQVVAGPEALSLP